MTGVEANTSGLEALFEKNLGRLAASLSKALQAGLEEDKRLQQAGQKGELSHIHISFLRSSVLCRLPWLRIDFYDKDDCGDISGCSADWDIPEIADKLYRDMDGMAKQEDRIPAYELEQALLGSVPEYFHRLQKFLPRILAQCPMAQGIGCQWWYGEYLGRVLQIGERDENAVF